MGKEYRIRFHRLIQFGAKLTGDSDKDEILKSECWDALQKTFKYLSELDVHKLLDLVEEEIYDTDKSNWKNMTKLDICKSVIK